MNIEIWLKIYCHSQKFIIVFTFNHIDFKIESNIFIFFIIRLCGWTVWPEPTLLTNAIPGPRGVVDKRYAL